MALSLLLRTGTQLLACQPALADTIPCCLHVCCCSVRACCVRPSSTSVKMPCSSQGEGWLQLTQAQHQMLLWWPGLLEVFMGFHSCAVCLSEGWGIKRCLCLGCHLAQGRHILDLLHYLSSNVVHQQLAGQAMAKGQHPLGCSAQMWPAVAALSPCVLSFA